jgi:tryptophan synthase alpha chain
VTRTATTRLSATFDRLRTERRGGLVAYVTAGDPDRPRSLEVLVAVARGGADVIEVGVPFSDPLADGPVIQRASERALAAGMTLRGALEMVREARARVDTPMVLFTYANPLDRMGAYAFAREASDAGVDGVLVLDCPIEEAGPLREVIVGHGMDPIFLVSPTTTDDRMAASARLGRGFLYVISRLGVTGARDVLAADIEPLIARVRAQSTLPVAIGFGISTPEQVAAACRTADAAVVGSALVDTIAKHGGAPDLERRVEEYVRWLKSAL